MTAGEGFSHLFLFHERHDPRARLFERSCSVHGKPQYPYEAQARPKRDERAKSRFIFLPYEQNDPQSSVRERKKNGERTARPSKRPCAPSPLSEKRGVLFVYFFILVSHIYKYSTNPAFTQAIYTAAHVSQIFYIFCEKISLKRLINEQNYSIIMTILSRVFPTRRGE